MPAAPPRFTPSPPPHGGGGGGGGSPVPYGVPTNHKRSSTVAATTANRARETTTQCARRTTHGAYAGDEFAADDDDPVHSSRRALGGAKMPASDLNNVNRLYVLLACVAGVVVSAVMVQTGLTSKGQAIAMKLPGDLYAHAMLCVIVPTVFFNSVLASMHFWTLNKAKALGCKMLAYFFATTLWAALLGMLFALCAVPLFPTHGLTRAATSVTVGKASVGFRCPATKNASVVFSDGSLRCQPGDAGTNGTLFLLQDLSDSFRLRSDPRNVLSLADAVMQLLERFFPANVFQSFLQGDVLSVIIIGAALGIALIQKSPVRRRENTPGFRTPAFTGGTDGGGHGGWAGQIFLLIMQCEVILSVLLRFLLKHLPVALVHMIAGSILEASAMAPADESSDLYPSTQDLVTLFAVLFFALLLELATVMAMTMVLTKANPLQYMAQLVSAQLVALGTSSSLVALPTTVRSIAATKQVSMPLAHFVCSTGTVLNKNGTALYLSVVSVYILATSSLREQALTTGNLVLLTLVSALCSMLTPALPRGHLLLVATILSSLFGIHDSSSLAHMVGFLTAMDWLLDPFVTAVNVTNNCLIALVLAVQIDETFIEHATFDAVSDTQEEDSNDGFPLDESDRHTAAGGPRAATAPAQHAAAARPRTDTHGSGTMRPPLIARMTSVGESVVSV